MSHRIMQLSNDSAMTYPLQVIVSPDDAQLVAAIVAGFSSQLTAALRAHLANNSTKKSLTLSYYPDGLYYARTLSILGAKRGFVYAGASLERVNAMGRVEVWEHPLSRNPELFGADFNYVVAVEGEDLAEKFEQRLALAIDWPTKPEWATHLIAVGKERDLVKELPMYESAPDDEELRAEWEQLLVGQRFTGALRFARDAAQWGEVLSLIAAGETA
jgi:hypothetical protein